MKYRDVKWGPVFVKAGPYKGRIGDLDDDDFDVGIVYFGTIFRHFSSARIPLRSLRHVTTEDLMNRSEAISRMISTGAEPIDLDDELDVLYEDHYISIVLQDRWLTAQEKHTSDFGVFLSHSSIDQQTVRWIAVDLANHGYRPWLDEWEIAAGESIPKRVSDGIEQCRAMVVALSPSAVASQWVEREWHSKYWDEVQGGNVAVIPLLLSRCNVPPLLRSKRYADFTQRFSEGMEDLLNGLRKINETKKATVKTRRKRV
jgi:hypothetical protein